MDMRAPSKLKRTRPPSPWRRWSTLITACLSLVMLAYLGAVCWFAVARSKSATPPAQQQTQQHEADARVLKAQQQRTLRFQVCNGFGNQRLAIMYAAILAKGTGRALVLPQLISEGTQRSFADNNGNEDSIVDFGAVYDVGKFKRACASQGLLVLTQPEAPPLSEYTAVQLRPFQTDTIDMLQHEHGAAPHIAVDCTLFKLFPLGPAHEKLAWAALEGLQPGPRMQAIADAAAAALEKRRGSGGGPSTGSGTAARGSGQTRVFNVLHLRFEDDWVSHCGRWEDIRDGVVRNNCYNNTENVGDFLKLMGVSTELPLYAAAHWPDVDAQRNASVMANLEAHGYKVVTSLAIMPEAASQLSASAGTPQELPRDIMACVDYTLALLSAKFIGNSVSTFSALALLERRHTRRWSIYYNDGNIPLTFPLPALHRLPWVFTYNSWSPLYDDMLKVAVRSAINVGGFTGYCLFLGDPQSSIYRWLEFHGIIMVHHEPAWKDQLVEAAHSYMLRNKGYSHLYKSADMLVSTFQRMDLPLVEEISQYNYVLFTDADVFFRRRITLDEFGLPLPDSIAMAYELWQGMYPLNAGVMLMHVPHLRQTYDDFLRFVLSNQQGMHFGPHGPVDQGAYNQYYSVANKTQLPQRYNLKVYNMPQKDGAIVHFHGPKPREFLKYAEQGNCDGFFWLCEFAWLGSLCDYWPTWHALFTLVKAEDSKQGFLTDTSEATHRMSTRMMDACRWLRSPRPWPMWTSTEQPTRTLTDLRVKKWHNGVYTPRYVDASMRSQ